jgi:hypothetical protein
MRRAEVDWAFSTEYVRSMLYMHMKHKCATQGCVYTYKSFELNYFLKITETFKPFNCSELFS